MLNVAVVVEVFTVAIAQLLEKDFDSRPSPSSPSLNIDAMLSIDASRLLGGGEIGTGSLFAGDFNGRLYLLVLFTFGESCVGVMGSGRVMGLGDVRDLGERRVFFCNTGEQIAFE